MLLRSLGTACGWTHPDGPDTLKTMRRAATHEDAQLILQLYDMRRETRMREARSWFSANCNFGSWLDFQRSHPMGSDGSERFWQVVSYWDMVGSFVAAGVLHKELFFESAGEMVFVWLRVEPMLAEMREAWREPRMLRSLQQAGNDYAEWTEKQSPGAYEAMKKFVAGE